MIEDIIFEYILYPLLFWPMSLFVENPKACAVMAVLLSLLAVVSTLFCLRAHNPIARSLWLTLPAVLWGLFIPYENALVGKGYNIRVDLLVIAPVLYLSTFITLIRWLLFLKKLVKGKMVEPPDGQVFSESAPSASSKKPSS